MNDSEHGSSRLSLSLKILGALAVLVGLFFAARHVGQYVPRFAEWVDGLGFWGPAVFVLGYAVATVALIPGSALTLAGGAIFGLGPGVAYVFAGATLGACAAFLVARYVARSLVERKMAGSERFRALDSAVGEEGRKITFLLRLSPIFPFVFLNYALGLTKVRFVDYLIACIGMLPGTLLYVYYGKVAGDVAAVAAESEPGPDRGAAYWLFLAVGLLATLVVTVYVTRLARKRLEATTTLEAEEAP